MPVRPQIHPGIIFRLPRFPLTAQLEDCWEELKATIRESSPNFFAIIEHIGKEELKTLPAKVSHTIRKYFNRAKYRPVPYSGFASIGFFENRPGQPNGITVGASVIEHNYFDWPYKKQLEVSFEDLVTSNSFLFANSTYYLVGRQHIRFVSEEDGKFELTDVELTDTILSILKACRHPIRLSRLRELIAAEEDSGLLPLVEELLSIRLLLSEFDPNIVGEDFFHRRGLQFDGLAPGYLICEREYLSGGLDIHILKHLPRLVPILQQLSPEPELNHLQSFIQRFSARFDQAEVPIMEALDPEIGVGYGEMELDGSADSLITHLASGRNHGSSNPGIREALARNLMKISDGLAVIQLEKLLIGRSVPKRPVANTLSAMITISDGLVHLEHIGGYSANALAGRFTLAGTGILSHCRQLAAEEQSANPGVTFFDLAYTSEAGVDNVNRRRAIYDSQLSIMNFDTSAEPLTLNDMSLSVRGGKLLLRSISTGRRLVPRMASAYNYTRSDLPVFRLLCDLQHQDVQSGLSLDIRQLITGLDYYPRIQFENIVVSPAQWRLDLSDCDDVDSLLGALREQRIGRYIRVGRGDQKLVIDTSHTPDLEMLLREWKQAGTLYAEEAFLPKESVVKDTNGVPYYSQLLLTLFHAEQVYAPSAAAPPAAGVVKRRFAPGNREWLYYEIYSHPRRANYLLLEKISLLLQQFHFVIKKWFFIRYNQGGDHLRLRLQFKDHTYMQNCSHWLHQLLEQELSDGIVSDLQQKTYCRELERYGAAYIEQVEEHFWIDSIYVLDIVALPDHDKYKCCIELAIDIQQTGTIEDETFLSILRHVYRAFVEEFNVRSADTQSINEQYASFRKQQTVDLDGGQQEKRERLERSFVSLLKAREPGSRRSLFTDLFHMHVNRLFSDNQRLHEMVIYNFLIKEWQRRKMASQSMGRNQAV